MANMPPFFAIFSSKNALYGAVSGVDEIFKSALWTIDNVK
jgi:hypothetical protein